MDLYGDNRAFGAEQVELSRWRRVEPASGEGAPFPRGTADLLRVVTSRKDGNEKVAYAFRLGPDDAGVAEASGGADEGSLVNDASTEEEPAAHAPSEEPAEEEAVICADEPAGSACVQQAVPGDAPAPAELTGEDVDAPADASEAASAPAPAPASDGTRPGLAALTEAVALINRMLEQAGELAHHEFGFVGGVQIGIPEHGSGYTYATIVPLDAHGQPSASPMHLHVETCGDPGSPDSLSSLIEYDAEGTPLRVAMTEYGEDYYCRINVTINEKTGRLSVQKVEEFLGVEHRPHLLYKRNWTPRSDAGRPGDRGGSRGGRDGWRGDDRGGRERGGSRWDDRGGRGGWRDDRDEDRWDDRGRGRDADRRGRGRASDRWDDRDQDGRWGDRDRRDGDRRGAAGGDWRAERDAQRAERDRERGRGGRWDDHDRGDRDSRDRRGSSGGDWRAERDRQWEERNREDRRGSGTSSRGDWRAERDRQYDERTRGHRGGDDRGGRGDRRSSGGPSQGDWRAERDAQRGRRDNDGRGY